jgi:tRNA A-37 threonylcarbamoyl transferase component Bud32
VSGTDPNGKHFGRRGDPTSPFQPGGADDGGPPGGTLPNDLPKLPGITLQYEIARGGMGVVYSGRQDFLDRRVAVKFLSVELGGEAFAKRFQREAKILAGISHPNIVGCHMADTTPQGQSYLVMEFIDGPSLKAWIGDNGPVAPIASLRLIRASAAALAHAHQSDIIHRDVKPENILLESVTSTAIDIAFPFTPKLVDLGLARMTHEQVGAGLTSPGSVMGTPSTMSPEQFDDPDSVDFRSDIYGLGCCLYEMLVGHPAFRGSKLTDIVLRKRDPDAPDPCAENASLPAAVGAFTKRLLASAREDRPASYKQLDQEIGELIEALQSAGGRTDTIAGMAGDVLDRTVPSKPGAFGGATPTAPAQPTQPAPPTKGGKTAPGMLNTGELDFLSEGVPPVDATPAFQEAPGGGRTVVTQGSSDTGATQPDGPAGGGKNGLIAVVAVLLLVGGGVGAFFAMNGGGEDPDVGGGQTGGTQIGGTQIGGAQGNVPNARPVVTIAQAPDTVAIGERFTIELEARDADGDDLDYEWIWPTDVIVAASTTSGPTVRFALDDGLPGVEMTISARVTDGRSEEPVVIDHRFVVGDGPVSKPLQTFKSDSSYVHRGSWTPANQDPYDLFVVGRVRNGPATLQKKVGEEPYWEWMGTLEPTEEEGVDTCVGLFAVTFGDEGLAVRATRNIKTRAWKNELLDRVPGQDQWTSRVQPIVREWTEPERTDNRSEAWCSIRRERSRLIVQIGEMVRPPAIRGNKPPEPTIVKVEPLVIDLTDAQVEALDSTGQITLLVPEWRCVYRLDHR